MNRTILKILERGIILLISIYLYSIIVNKFMQGYMLKVNVFTLLFIILIAASIVINLHSIYYIGAKIKYALKRI